MKFVSALVDAGKMEFVSALVDVVEKIEYASGKRDSWPMAACNGLRQGGSNIWIPVWSDYAK